MLQATFLVLTLTVVAAIFFLVVERLPGWLKTLGKSRPFTAIQGLLAPIGLPDWIKYSGFAIWLMLLAILLAGLFLTIGIALWQNLFFDSETPVELRFSLITITALTGVTGAVIALPFTLRRSIQAERQTRTAEEGYVTEQINGAVASLAAQKEVNRLGRTFAYKLDDRIEQSFEWQDEAPDLPEGAERPDEPKPGNWQPAERTEPNIEVRIGAILALERLARQRADIATGELKAALGAEPAQLTAITAELENVDLHQRDTARQQALEGLAHRTTDGILDHDAARDHTRIMEILCAYIRENAPAGRARPLELDPWPELADDATTEEIAKYRKLCDAHRETWGSEIKRWKCDHPGPRSDIQTALRVLGRRTNAQRACEGVEIAERETFCRTEITRRHWKGYRLDLQQTDLQLADLAHSADRPMTLAHAHLNGARMQGAQLTATQVQGARISSARMTGANLWGADLQGADFCDTDLRCSEMLFARLQNANLGGVSIQGTALSGVKLDGCNISSTNMRGASLINASLDRATVSYAQIDLSTTLEPISAWGASLRSTNLPYSEFLEVLLPVLFGDASVLFEGNWPKEFVITKDGKQRANTNGKLAHWSSEDLDYEEFEEQSRAFQDELDRKTNALS